LKDAGYRMQPARARQFNRQEEEFGKLARFCPTVLVPDFSVDINSAEAFFSFKPNKLLALQDNFAGKNYLITSDRCSATRT
jgi:hypothetical protein